MAAFECKIWTTAAFNPASVKDAGKWTGERRCRWNPVKLRFENAAQNAHSVHLYRSEFPPKVRRMITRSPARAASGSQAVLEVEKRPEKLVATLLSLVDETDRGVKLNLEEKARVDEVATELEQFCVPEPLKDPRVFGEWDVLYCSKPTAPGGYYRSVIGRALLRTDEMVQTLSAPDMVGNKVVFSLFGFLGGEVSLRGKLTVQDAKWIQIVFESPFLKFGSTEFQYGGSSTVKIAVTYLDETLRLGRGSRGSLFVFRRRA